MTPTEMMLRHFTHAHLPAALQKVSRPFGELAEMIATSGTAGPETTTALRKLLEAKDCAVRAHIHEQVAPTFTPLKAGV